MKKSKRNKKMGKKLGKYNDINLTAVLLRFLKDNNAFSNFKHALKTKVEGKALYDTFYALKFDEKGCKEKYANDPIKWLIKHEDSRLDGEMFFRDIFNAHIYWKHTKEGNNYWANLDSKWKTFIDLDLNRKEFNENWSDTWIKLNEEDEKKIRARWCSKMLSLLFLTISFFFFLISLIDMINKIIFIQPK